MVFVIVASNVKLRVSVFMVVTVMACCVPETSKVYIFIWFIQYTHPLDSIIAVFTGFW
jgi:hypothetical protein